MSGDFHGVPLPLLGGLLTAAGSVAGWFGRTILRGFWWERDEVRALRKALDRVRRRENAYATGYELMLIVVPERLSRPQRLAIERACALLETAMIGADGEV